MKSTFARVLGAGALIAALASAAPANAGGSIGERAGWCHALPGGGSCHPAIVRAPRALLRLAVAETEKRRERGLMDVKDVPHGEGMLFVFADGDAERGFWMKDTITPLDMVWVRSDGVVSSIAQNVPATPPNTPDDKVARRSGIGIYVIELRAGEAQRVGLAAGLRLKMPVVLAQ